MAPRLIFVLWLPLLLVVAASSQITQFKSYKTQEDYCRDNPKALTCIDGKPLKMTDLSAITDPMAGYCRNHPHSPGCESRCGKSLLCIDDSAKGTKLYGETGTRSTTTQNSRLQTARPTIKDPNLTADWRFAHPSADFLLGINVASLRQSSTVRALLEQLTTAFQLSQQDLESALAEADGVDQCWVSVRSHDPLILLQGRMDFPAGFMKLGNGMTSYRISKNAVVLGRESSVAASVQRLSHPTVQAAGALRMRDLETASDVWFTGNRSFVPAGQTGALYDGLNGYAIGFRLQDGVKVDVRLKYATLPEARHILSWLRSIPPPAALADISAQVEQQSVHIAFRVPEAQLSQAVSQLLDAPIGKRLTELAAKSVHSSNQITVHGLPGGPMTFRSTPHPTPPPGKIVVYGLEGGPKVM